MKSSGGYTFHEHYDKLGLINMNGRVYDPIVGRFLSVDPVVGNPLSAQDYNGYSYCANNPLKYTDPSGYIKMSLNPGCGFGGTGSPTFGEYGSRGGGSDFGGYGSSVGDYFYDYTSSTYRTSDAGFGQVSFGEVYHNYIVPNAWYTLNGKAAIAFMKGLQHIYAEKKDIRNQPAMPGWPKLIPSNKTLIDFARKFFGQYKYLDKVCLIYDDVLTSEKKDIANVDNRLYEDKYNIFFSTYAFNSSWQLFMTMGHEFVHVANFIENPGIPVDQSEWASYKYEAYLCGNMGFDNLKDYYNNRATKWYDGTPRGKYWVYDKWGLPTKYPGY